ncbi:MAG: hypothetical protein WA484_16620 [Solirubrobacteraceae bacterium]
MKEQPVALLTLKPQAPHRFLNPRILWMGEVIEHNEGAISEHRPPHLHLTHGVVPVVRAVDVQKINHPTVSWTLIARGTH